MIQVSEARRAFLDFRVGCPEHPPGTLILAGNDLSDLPTNRTAYRFRDWDRKYEIKETRDLKAARWVALPNRLDGDFYCDIVAHENGAAFWGVHVAVMMVASSCQPRGTLIREDGKPHTSDTLSNKTKIKSELIQAALDYFVQIEVVDVIPWVCAVQIPIEKPHTNGVAKAPDLDKEFEVWCARWVEATGKDTAREKVRREWDKHVAILPDRTAFYSCTERYLQSGEVARGAIMNRDKWIRENAKDHWSGKWPPASKPVKSSERDTLVEDLKRMEKK
jgi:hypothetical protein